MRKVHPTVFKIIANISYREICDQTKELKNLDHHHKCRNTVNKEDSILNGIDHHGFSNEYFKVRIKNHPGATAENICDNLKLEIQEKPDVVIIHTGTNDLTQITANHEKIITVW